MKVLVPSLLGARHLDEVRAVSAGIDVATFSVDRPTWVRALARVSRRWLPHHVYRTTTDVWSSRDVLRANWRPGDGSAIGAEVLLAASWMDARVVSRAVDSLPQLRWIHSMTAGVERFALAELTRRRIELTAPLGVHSRRVAEFVMAVVYSEAKRLMDRWRGAERYARGCTHAVELETLTMGIVGYGSIGREVARLASANGVHVVAHVRGNGREPAVPGVATRTELRDVLGVSDVVVLALPLTEETRGLIGNDALRAVRPGVVLINVGRGGTVGEDALLRALRDGTVRRAYLDVLDDGEDAPPSHPLLCEPNVVYTHHSAAASLRSDDEVFAGFLDNLRRYCNGRPLQGRVETGAARPQPCEAR